MGTLVGMGAKKPETAEEKKIEKLEKENKKLQGQVNSLTAELKTLKQEKAE